MTTHRPIEAVIHTILVRRLRRACADAAVELASDTPILGRGVGLDSLEALSLVTEIEAEFGVQFDDEELTEELFKDVGTLTTHVRRKMSAIDPGTGG